MRSCLLLLCFPLWGLAQTTVNFEVTPKIIGINESISFAIVVSNPTDRGRQPAFEPRMNTGPFTLQNRIPKIGHAATIINGKSDSKTTYTYYLKPTRKGKLTFPSQSLVYQGHTYKSAPVVVDVSGQTNSVQQPRDPFGNRRRQPRVQYEVFGTAEVESQEYFLGEPIILDVNIYTTPGLYVIGRESSLDMPDFKDFWVEEIEQSPTNPVRVKRDDKIYEKTPVSRKRLFATRVGDIEIEPVNFQLVVSTSPSSFLTRGSRANRVSSPVKLKIKPLPERGRPADFSGLVGNFKLEGTLDKNSLKKGETVSFTLRLSGSGNYNALNNLSLDELKQDFEIFDGGLPTTEQDSQGAIIAKTWAFALVPVEEGTYQIPMPQVSYFNPKIERYETTEAGNFPLEVLPGQGLGDPIQQQAEAVKLVAEQNLNFIKFDQLGDLNQDPVLAHPVNLVRLVGILLTLDIIVFLGLFMRSRGASRRENMRPAFAHKNFKRALTRLRVENADAFFGDLSQAILDYFGDKWERPGQGVSLEMIRDRFDRDGLNLDLYDKVAECIEACDLARFTPSSPGSRESLVQKTRTIIEEVEGALS